MAANRPACAGGLPSHSVFAKKALGPIPIEDQSRWHIDSVLAHCLRWLPFWRSTVGDYGEYFLRDLVQLAFPLQFENLNSTSVVAGGTTGDAD